jgi:dTDP-4-dehydrorhamnose reductase
MKVLLTGAAGQLGQALISSTPPGVELIACGRAELDLANPGVCRAAVEAHRPHWVLNAGAYTAVDRAESEPELAQAVNAGAPAAFAEALAETGGRLLQVSTDFVFNGQQGSPYRPEQPVDPLGLYGASKAAGEAAGGGAGAAHQLGVWAGGP